MVHDLADYTGGDRSRSFLAQERDIVVIEGLVTEMQRKPVQGHMPI